jgi:ubiquinone/menaquinone biosynthesis C-methylase UbiE
MEAEFDTVARWTEEVIRDIGADSAIPAACRGSASPAALSWLADRLQLRAGDTVLDSGAGLGGPAAWLREEHGVAPVLCDPMQDACAAAHRMFGMPTVVAWSESLPFGSEVFPAAWCLGVLCTTTEQQQLLRELRRVLVAGGRLGLLVFVQMVDELDEAPEGNHFPTGTQLAELLAAAGFSVVAERTTDGLPAPPSEWTRVEEVVERELRRRHGTAAAWRQAEQQQESMGALLRDGRVAARLLVTQRR